MEEFVTLDFVGNCKWGLIGHPCLEGNSGESNVGYRGPAEEVLERSNISN